MFSPATLIYLGAQQGGCQWFRNLVEVKSVQGGFMVMVYGVTGERRVERVGNFFLKRLRSQRGVPFFLPVSVWCNVQLLFLNCRFT